MNKKGQVAVFVILAILIIVGGAILFYFLSDFRGKVEGVTAVGAAKADVQNINGFINECLESVTVEALYVLGIQGGYTDAPPGSILSPPYRIAYGHYLDENTLAPTSVMESELSAYIEQNLPVCTDGFVVFEDLGYNVAESNVKTDTVIGDAMVRFEIDYPVILSKDDTRITLNEFN